MFNRRPNMLKHLAAALEGNDVWRSLATNTSKVLDELIQDPRDRDWETYLVVY